MIKKIIVIGVIAVSIILLFSLFSVFLISPVSALPPIVKPSDLRSGEDETFDGDGAVPDESWYNFTGDYSTTTDNITFSTTTVDLFIGNESLNISGTAGDNSTFEFNESDYFAIDFYLKPLEDSGISRFEFLNGTDVTYSFELRYRYEIDDYVSATDFNSDGHNNYEDIYEIYGVYGHTGSPGWIKEDLKADGVINYLDISWFIAHYSTTDYWDVVQVGGNQHHNKTIYTYSFSDATSWLHCYFQWAYSPTYPGGYSSFVFMAFRPETDSSDGDWNVSGYNYNLCNATWTNLSITSVSDTICYFDNLTVYKTPLDIAVNSYSPSGNTTITDMGEHSCFAYVDYEISFYLLNNPQDIPMFAFVDLWQFTFLSGIWEQTGFFESNYSQTGFDLIVTNETLFQRHKQVEFNYDYYWSVNISTEPIEGYGYSEYVWEFPQALPQISGRWCYTYFVNPYPDPYVSSWFPAHNATEITLSDFPYVVLNDINNKSGTFSFYMLDNTSKVWVFQGQESYYNGENKTLSTFWSGISLADFYDEDFYWYVALKPDCIGGLYEYPNATQAGMYMYGHKAWKLTTEHNYPPVVNSYAPANNSVYDPWADTIYINISDNTTGEDDYLSFSMWVITNESWYIGGTTVYKDTLHLLVLNNSRNDGEYILDDDGNCTGYSPDHKWYYFDNGTLNFTWTPEDIYECSGINPLNGTYFSWGIRLSDIENTVWFPSDGTGRYNTNFTGVGDWWINYIVDYTHDNQLPTLSVSYPTDTTYTKSQWKNNHELSVTVNDQEGDDIYLFLTINTTDGYLVEDFILDPSGKSYFDGFYTYDLPYLTNGSYDFDLSYYIPYDNTEYTMTLSARDDYPGHALMAGTTTHVQFSIGSPPGKKYHLAVMGFDPSNGEMNGISAVSAITGYISLNRANENSSKHWTGYQVAVFVADGVVQDGINPLLMQTKGRMWYSAVGIGHSTILPFVYYITNVDAPSSHWQYFAGFNIKNTKTHYPWAKFSLTSSLVAMHDYKMWIGLYTGVPSINPAPTLFGNDFDDFQRFPANDVEFNNLYDDSLAPCPDFRYNAYNLGGAHYIMEPPYDISNPGDYGFTGGRSTFSTYTNYNQIITNIPNVMANIGISGGGLLLSLFIIGLFSLMPYILIKRKARSVPMPVIASFTLFGVILSFGMGLLDMWIFAVVFFILLMVIFYKAWAYITSKKTDEGAEK